MKTTTLDSIVQSNNVEGSILDAFNIIKSCFSQGGKLLLCGNGGSAADSEHIVGELMKGFLDQRKVSNNFLTDYTASFGIDDLSVVAQLQQGLPAISLVSNSALNSAIINDMDPSLIFAQQIFSMGKRSDALLAISTSGNSRNVVLAAKVAKAKGLKVVALTGGDGGELKQYCDVAIIVPHQRVDKIQEAHLPIYHRLCLMLEACFFGNSSGVDINKTCEIPAINDIELIVFDFDGVMTDNKVYTDSQGNELVLCDRRDSLGLNQLKKAGLPMMILSTEKNPVVAARAKKIGIEVKYGCDNKKSFLEKYLKENGMDSKKCIFIGNDLNDREAMEYVGFSVCPNDAHSKIKEISSLVLTKSGGHGFVREFSEYLLEKELF